MAKEYINELNFKKSKKRRLSEISQDDSGDIG